MTRIPAATKENVPEDQRAAFDEAVQQYGRVPTDGPVYVMMNVPEVASRGNRLTDYLTHKTILSTKITELAILLAARETDCQHVWKLHAGSAREAGLRDEIVGNLRDRKELTGLTPEEVSVVNYGRELFRTHRVGHATYDAALAQFGVRGLVELTNLMGWYVLLAFNANAFEVESLRAQDEPAMPI